MMRPTRRKEQYLLLPRLRIHLWGEHWRDACDVWQVATAGDGVVGEDDVAFFEGTFGGGGEMFGLPGDGEGHGYKMR